VKKIPDAVRLAATVLCEEDHIKCRVCPLNKADDCLKDSSKTTQANEIIIAYRARLPRRGKGATSGK
jgi:hypothetical protein